MTVNFGNNNPQREVFLIKKEEKQSNPNLSNYKITREFSNKSVKELIINSLKVVK